MRRGKRRPQRAVDRARTRALGAGPAGARRGLGAGAEARGVVAREPVAGRATTGRRQEGGTSGPALPALVPRRTVWQRRSARSAPRPPRRRRRAPPPHPTPLPHAAP